MIALFSKSFLYILILASLVLITITVIALIAMFIRDLKTKNLW